MGDGGDEAEQVVEVKMDQWFRLWYRWRQGEMRFWWKVEEGWVELQVSYM